MTTFLVTVTLIALWVALFPLAGRIANKDRREAAEAYLYLAPAGLLLLAFWFVPVAFSVFISLTDWASGSNFSTVKWVGFAQYAKAWSDPGFWSSLWNTLNYVVYSVPLTIGASLAVALALNNPLVKGRGALRTLYFLPYVTTWVAISIVFKYVFNEQFGLANGLLEAGGFPTLGWLGESRGIWEMAFGVGAGAPHGSAPPHALLAGPSLSMFTIIMTSVWRDTGYFMVIFLAGLQNIDRSYYEAAEIDGAGPWQRFRHVTLPLLGPTTLFVSIIALITAFKVFVPQYVMTPGGGPGKTTATLVYYVYELGFQGEFNLAYASAVAYILFFIILALTRVQDAVFGRKVHYD